MSASVVSRAIGILFFSLCGTAVIAQVPAVAGPDTDNRQRQMSAAELQHLTALFEASQRKEMALNAIAEDRESFVSAIIEQWRSAAARRRSAERGLFITRTALMQADAERLYEASLVTSYEALLNVAAGRSGEASTSSDILGSANLDLVYTPINPCRALDSRHATGSYDGISFGGPYAPNSAHSFAVTDPLSFYGSQGGSANCGIPIGAARAVVLNITVAAPSTYGNLRIYPFGTAAPNASILNFNPSQNVANAVVAPICLGCNQDLVVVNDYSATHVIVDVLGYFAAPLATPLQQTIVSSAATVVLAGAPYELESPACPSGYTLVGGGYNETETGVGHWVWQSSPAPGGTTWRVRGYNNIADMSLSVFATCARVPGR